MSEENKKQRKNRGHHGPAFAMHVKKAKDFKGTLRRLVRYISVYKWGMLIVVMTAILGTIFNIQGPKIMGDGINKITEGFDLKNPSTLLNFKIDYDYLFWNIIMVLIGLYVFSAFFRYVQQYLMATISQKTVYALRRDINHKLPKLPLKYFDSRTHGETLSRITNDIDMIATTLSQSVTQIITSLALIIGIIWMMFSLSWQLTLIVLSTLPVSIFISVPILKKAQTFFKGQQKSLGDLSGHVEEMYTGHKIVKAYGHEEDAIEDFEKINEELYQHGWKAQFITGIIMPIMTFVNNLGYVFVTVGGVWLSILGKLRVGYIQSFVSYTRQFAQPIRQTASISNTLQLTIAAAERVFELLDEEEMEQDISRPSIVLTNKGYMIPFVQYDLTEDTKVLSTDLGFVVVDKDMQQENIKYQNVYEINHDEIIGKLIQYPESLQTDFTNLNIRKSNQGYVSEKQSYTLDERSKVVKTDKGYAVVSEDYNQNGIEYMQMTKEVKDKLIGQLIAYPKGYVNFSHVDFKYKEDTPLIEDMNIFVKPGQTVAIVGPTGAGKTTIVNLLMRFYEIQKGVISIDGINITNLRRDDLRNIFGMVLQDTWMFNGTIKDNIAYGRMDATDEEIIAAAKAAEADHFIRTLPDGYNTVLNEETSNISQGQKQLLTIARALLANPQILILDEATSSVDTRTEFHIQKAMTELMKGRTNFVIAHRLSTIKNADVILVMNHGRIIEQGNHESLLAKDGFYADLYNSQFAHKQVENV